jgi:hypothetical protein
MAAVKKQFPDDAEYLGERWREAGALAGFETDIRQGPALFLLTLGVLLGAAFAAAAGAWYLAAPRLAQWSPALPRLTLVTAALAALYVLAEYVGLIATVVSRRRFLLPLAAANRVTFRLMPAARCIGRLLGAGGDRLTHSFVELSNALTRARPSPRRTRRSRREGPVLVLLPRCLQRPTCSAAIVEDIANCRRCGDCMMGDIVALGERYDGVVLAVLSGGSLARGLIRRLEPRAVVGVACERELFDGLAAVDDRPVLGVANQRPVGPCRATVIRPAELEAALGFFAGR